LIVPFALNTREMSPALIFVRERRSRGEHQTLTVQIQLFRPFQHALEGWALGELVAAGQD
jgi:hypothetical protein